jgi:hypothetical protein
VARETAPARRDVSIRPSTEADLRAISALFTPPLDVGRLRWLLGDPARGSLRSFVAVEGERVVGHVGYTLSRFHTPRGALTGLFCVNWVVDASCRGLGVGSRLFEATFPLADFSYEYGGTEFSHKLFVDMGFEQTLHLEYRMKVLRPLSYARILADRWPRRIAKAAAFAGLSRARSSWWRSVPPGLALAPHRPGARVEAPPAPCVANTTPDDQIEWYGRCPGARTAAFTITAGGVPIGTGLCLVREHPAGTRTGRIVHLSYLGEDAARWRGAVVLLESWLADQGCAAVSAFASHRHLLGALGEGGYLTRGRTPFWLRDREHGLPRAGWHLTGLEGDIGDRRV